MTEPLKGAVHTDAETPPERLRARLLDDDEIELLTATEDDEGEPDDAD
jgi:hypothetical protein